MAETLRGTFLTPDGYVEGQLVVDGTAIAAIDGRPVSEDDARRSGRLILPGFIDLHVHGGGGADTMDGGDAVRTLARTHARHGTTALLATTMTAPRAELEAALSALAPQVHARPPGCARVLGVHLEGPWISPRRLGAQPDEARAPEPAEWQALRALAPIRVLTLAPEQHQTLALIPSLVEAGVRVQIGHTDASYEQVCEALQAGAAGFTHLFNAMGALHHRAPGAVGAALAHGRHAELIPDLLHLHPGTLRLALRALPDSYAVTDATAAAGMPDGEYRLGRQRVNRCAGAVRLADGTLAGSALTMDQALRNLVQIGLPLADAARRVSTVAADYLGEAGRGRLIRGASADLVELDGPTLQLRRVWVEGEAIDGVGEDLPAGPNLGTQGIGAAGSR